MSRSLVWPDIRQTRLAWGLAIDRTIEEPQKRT